MGRSRKIAFRLGPDGLVLTIPLELIVAVLKPRVQFASGEASTPREKEVLSGIQAALSNKEIASKLNLSERTVKFHVSSLLRKNKVGSRVQLQAMYANAEGER